MDVKEKLSNGKRLIDADALYSEIEDEYDLYYGEIVTNPRRFAEMVEDAPTVDAVEVVRCKKCIYFEPYTDYLDGKTCNRGYCIYWEREALAADTTIFDHDFCSRGKRKD